MLARSITQGAERMVLDIRNNGGGLFPAGVEVGRQLLNRGDIVLIADRCVRALPTVRVAEVRNERRPQLPSCGRRLAECGQVALDFVSQ